MDIHQFYRKSLILSFSNHKISIALPKIHTFWQKSFQDKMILSFMVEATCNRIAAILDRAVQLPGDRWISVKQVFELLKTISSWFN